MVVTILALIYVGYRLLKDYFEPEIPAGYHNNWKLESQDSTKVLLGQMTKKQFENNIKNGKYR